MIDTKKTTNVKTPVSQLGTLSNIILGVVGVLALLRAFVLTEIDVGEVGVRYNNALGLQRQDLLPGYHLEVMGMQRIWRLPAHFLVLDFDQQGTLSIRTKDNNTVTVDVAVPYRVKQGEAWQIMDAGNHLSDGDGRFRFQRFAEQTATDVLRGHLAQLRSEDFYNTERRLEVANSALAALNEKLATYHLEANTVLIRAAYFRPEYETQLAQIQLNEQQKLLDGAKQAVAMKQQSLDNFTQQTNALVSAKEQDWGKRVAELDRAYQVGLLETGEDRSPGAARRKLMALTAEERATLSAQAAELFGLQLERIKDGHLLGIKNIEGETMEYSQRTVAEADAVSARLSAEGEAKISRIKGNYEGRVNQLLNSPAGRAYVGYNAADKVNFASDLTFQSKDGIPSVLRLGDFAKKFIGQ